MLLLFVSCGQAQLKIFCQKLLITIGGYEVKDNHVGYRIGASNRAERTANLNKNDFLV